MFDYEKVFSEYEDIIKLEWMDYDAKVFKMPIIYKRAVDLMFQYHTLTYSDFGGMKRLRELVVDYEKHLSKLTEIDNPCVFIGNGVSSLIWPVLRAVFDLNKNKYKKEAVLFSPDYPLFHSAVEGVGGTPIMINSDRKNDYLPTISQLKNAVNENTIAVLFSNPKNPTGKCLSREWIDALIKLSDKYNFFILSDEIYIDSVFDKSKVVNIAEIKKGFHNYVKFFGLSKDRPGMTGLRCGYCIGDNRLFSHIENIQLIRNLSNGIIADYIFLLDVALRYKKISGIIHPDLKYYSKEEIDDYFKVVRDNFKLQKKYNDRVIAKLKNNPHVIDCIVPDGGNCVFFRYYKNLPDTELLREFADKGLAIYPGDAFSMDYENEGSWTRICVTRDIDFLEKAIDKI